MVRADVVVVSYNSAETLRDCVEPLANAGDLDVIVVDNASSDGTLETVRDLPGLRIIAAGTNGGFARGCNAGWRAGTAPAVLFLNPDARISADGVGRLVDVLDRVPAVGAVAPRMTNDDGELEFSLRRFPRTSSTFAQALFLHRLFPRSPWADELIRDPGSYEEARTVEWVSGACVLVRRSALEQIGGWDEGFFLYAEDVDLCRRLSRAGWAVRFEPSVAAIHIGGVSAPRARLLPTLAVSRARYSRLHHSRSVAGLHRAGIALGELTHACLSTKGQEARRGHLAAFRAVCTGRSASADARRSPVDTSTGLH